MAFNPKAKLRELEIRASVGLDRSAGTREHLRRWFPAALSTCVLTLLVTAAAGHAAGRKRHSAKYWKGKNIALAAQRFGDPIQMTPLVETGGTLYIFGHHGHHWVFETDPGGKIVKLANVE